MVDQRAALFGSRNGKSPNVRGNDDKAAYSREVLERQNDAAIDDLEAKVGQLAHLSRGIGKEAKESNGILDDMGLDFDKAGTLLKGTMGHLKTMMNNRGGSHMCYMVLFVIVLFFTMYFLRGIGSRIGGGGKAALEPNVSDVPADSLPTG